MKHTPIPAAVRKTSRKANLNELVNKDAEISAFAGLDNVLRLGAILGRQGFSWAQSLKALARIPSRILLEVFNKMALENLPTRFSPRPHIARAPPEWFKVDSVRVYLAR